MHPLPLGCRGALGGSTSQPRLLGLFFSKNNSTGMHQALPSPHCPHPCVTGIKRLQNGQGQQDRFRVLVSDGEFSHSCMLATQLGDLIHGNSLKENSIVTLHDFISNAVQNKK